MLCFGAEQRFAFYDQINEQRQQKRNHYINDWFDSVKVEADLYVRRTKSCRLVYTWLSGVF